MILYHAVTCTETRCAPYLHVQDRHGEWHWLDGCPISDPTVAGPTRGEPRRGRPLRIADLFTDGADV